MPGGSQKSTSEVNVPEMTPEERALIQKQVELADQQLAAIRTFASQQNALQPSLFADVGLVPSGGVQNFPSFNPPPPGGGIQAETPGTQDAGLGFPPTRGSFASLTGIGGTFGSQQGGASPQGESSLDPIDEKLKDPQFLSELDRVLSLLSGVGNSLGN